MGWRTGTQRGYLITQFQSTITCLTGERRLPARVSFRPQATFYLARCMRDHLSGLDVQTTMTGISCCACQRIWACRLKIVPAPLVKVYSGEQRPSVSRGGTWLASLRGLTASGLCLRRGRTVASASVWWVTGLLTSEPIQRSFAYFQRRSGTARLACSML